MTEKAMPEEDVTKVVWKKPKLGTVVMKGQHRGVEGDRPTVRIDGKRRGEDKWDVVFLDREENCDQDDNEYFTTVEVLEQFPMVFTMDRWTKRELKAAAVRGAKLWAEFGTPALKRETLDSRGIAAIHFLWEKGHFVRTRWSPEDECWVCVLHGDGAYLEDKHFAAINMSVAIEKAARSVGWPN